MSKITFMRDLNLKEHSGEFYVSSSDFIAYLRKSHKPSDNMKIIKTNNVLREFERLTDAIKVVEDVTCIRLHSIFRYMFNHANNLEICKRVSEKLTKYVITDKKNDQDATVLEIYQSVINSKCFEQTDDQMLSKLGDDAFVLPYIHSQYRTSFSDTDWKKICLFEHQFTMYVGDEPQTYEKSIYKRKEFLKIINSGTDLCAVILNQSNMSVQKRNTRKQMSDKMNGVLLQGTMKHIHEVIETDVSTYMENTTADTILHIVALECDENCSHTCGIHLVMEIKSGLKEEELDDLSFLARCFIKRTHKENCPEIVFLQPGTIKDYIIDKNLSRYNFRDDLFRNKIRTIFCSTHIPDKNENSADEQDRCPTCFQEDINILPLDWTSFDIVKEWYLDVPLILQVILGTFINKTSVKKSTDSELFLKTKMEKLYSTYDRLLNILNRMYIGVLQQRNTNELSAHFHSVTTVFEVTNASGATLSLVEAERQLKDRANNDLCYYNTFLKKYPIQLSATSDSDITYVNLRECILLFMMDNLVRLAKHQDTSRSESRSYQLCTLPLSVKGLPLTNDIIESWHTNPDCDGTDSCVCKKDTHLSKENGYNLLFHLTTEETKIQDSYSQMNRWYFLPMWKQIKQENEIHKLLSTTLSVGEPEHNMLDELEQLEKSFLSMSMEGDEFDSDMSFDQEIPDIDMEVDPVIPRNFGTDLENSEQNILAEDTGVSNHIENDEHSRLITSNGTQDSMYDSVYTSDFQSSMDIEHQSSSNLTIAKVRVEQTDEQHGSKAVTDQHSITLLNSNDNSQLVDSVIPRLVDNSETASQILVGSLDFEEVDFDEEENLDIILHDIPSENVIDKPLSTDTPVETKEDSEIMTTKRMTGLFGFTIYQPPPLLCRHPPPATGKDDDVFKLQEILDDLLIKSGNTDRKDSKTKILFAPDNKIGKNLLQLMKTDPKYEIFLPDFPPLHLRKSKIVNLFSAYKDCGLSQILQYMKDDKEKEWTKLITLDHIDIATRYVWRIQMALQLAFFLQFILSISAEDSSLLIRDMDVLQESNLLHFVEKWDAKYVQYIMLSTSENATFRLHAEMLKHCQEVTAIYLGERIAGPTGYRLLLSAVKESLTFAFMNGATSYASYATDLLHHHYKSGLFYQNMKFALFSTPYENSQANFGMDAQREMEHIEALRSFRSGGTISSVIPRMALIDELNSAHQSRTKEEHKEITTPTYEAGFEMTQTDLKHVIPTAVLIIRRGGISTETNIIPYNVYNKEKTMLSSAVLDSETQAVGKYMVEKYVSKEEIFGYRNSDTPKADTIEGPRALVDKVKKSKGTTLRRTKIKCLQTSKTDREVKEEKRQKKVERMKRKIDALSSEMNACQALLKPDCSKPKVQKAKGVQSALTALLAVCTKQSEDILLPKKRPNLSAEDFNSFSQAGLYWSNTSKIPEAIAHSVRFVTLEFAGVKFKARVQTGLQYLRYVENGVLKDVKKQFPFVEQIVLCEEKYEFTPDDFKSATRDQRQRKGNYTCISHLKTGDEILSDNLFERESVTQTDEGKSLISTYVAKNAQNFAFGFDLKLTVDSQFDVKSCECEDNMAQCECYKYTVPVCFEYRKEIGYKTSVHLEDIQQRKGEAEMAQVDWVMGENDQDDRSPIFSVVSSGDIDSVLIHMFAVSKKWKRGEERKFLRQVYVSLQKPGKTSETYCITQILEYLENAFSDPQIGMKLSAILSIGGNDFLPKFYGVSHYKVMTAFLADNRFRTRLFQISENRASMTIDTTIYKEFVKCLYCPKSLDPSKLSFEDVRYLSVYGLRKAVKAFRRSPQMWMPPSSALGRLCCLINSQLEYMSTAGCHEARLPNFIGNGGLQTNETGRIEYDFGPDANIGDVETMLTIPGENFENRIRMARTVRKRRQNETPQKGQRRKTKRSQPLTSTPRK